MNQALAMVDILLARFGGKTGYGIHNLPLPQNEEWLVIVASGGYVIILSAILGSYFRGQSVPQFMVSVLSIKSTAFRAISDLCQFYLSTENNMDSNLNNKLTVLCVIF